MELPWMVKLTIESTCLCCPWSEFHEKADELVGHPIWSHEFGDHEFNLTLKVAVAAFDEGCAFHPMRDEGPLESLVRMIA